MNGDRVYQIENLEKTLKEVKDVQEMQTRTLSDIRHVLKDISDTIKSFQKMNGRIVDHEARLRNLEGDCEEFKELRKNIKCQTHEIRLGSLEQSDSFQNKNMMTFIITGFVALCAAGLTWLLTVKIK